ncbi:helix-turn-helix transcriptional regulator [Methylophilus glucosoxydans]|uniref:Helix-turn-helix transcriptional regulator n=1 Tax=Methylophilus glucosoxydans TaxID=752553 RepID=A0ABW3GLZ9_9PROT
MLNTSSAIEELVDLIYETLERPALWDAVFDRISNCFGLNVIASSSILSTIGNDMTSSERFSLSSHQPLFNIEGSSSSDHALLQNLDAHIRRVVYLKQLITKRKQQAETSVRMLDLVRPCVVMLREEGEIVHINPAARGLLRANNLLSIRANRIWSPNPKKYQQLKSTINRMIALKDATHSGKTDSHLVIRHHKDALYMYLSIISNQSNTVPSIQKLLEAQAIVMMQITDLNQGLSSHAKEQLLSAYQLSKAELNIAGLVAEGLQVNEIADLLQLSANTIRAQLKAIYKKTNTSRQAELMQLLLRFD